MSPLADVARRMFAAAVGAVQPDTLIRRLSFSPAGVSFNEQWLHPLGELVLIALGKAAPGLAAAFMRRSERPPEHVFVLTPDGIDVPASIAPHTRRARHPLPDERGAAATAELLELLAGLGPDDAVVVLLSGGSSALLSLPLAESVALDELTRLTRALLRAGADITELNTVRKHLMAAAGGRLAAATAAPLLTLVLSDVPGDDLSTIASGPTVADPTTFADAAAVLERHRLAAEFAEVARFLAAAPASLESPKPGDLRLDHARTRLLGTSRDALEAAADAALEAGLAPRVLTRRMRGEASRVGEVLGGLAASLTSSEGTALLLAGETTVTVRGDGVGGRNLEVALTAAAGLADVSERCVLAAGTDGIDGTSPAAGAVVDGNTLRSAVVRGRDAAIALARNDAWGFFSDMPEAIVTGPTGTNVADLAFVLAAGAPRAFLAAFAARMAQQDRPPVGIPLGDASGLERS